MTLKFSGWTWPIRSRSTKLSFIGVTRVSALMIAARAIGSSRPGVSMTMTSACSASRSIAASRPRSLWSVETS